MFELKYYRGYLPARPAAPTPLAAFNIRNITAKGWLGRAKSWLLRATLPSIFWFFRNFWPNPRFGRLILVTRASDVLEVLNKPLTFSVPYGPEMTELAGGATFVLGLEGAEHDEQRDVIVGIVRADDIPRLLRQTTDLAEALVKGSAGRIDAMRDLITRVATETCVTYFGLEVSDREEFADCTLALSNLLFADPFGNPDNRQTAFVAAAKLRGVFDRAIGNAKAKLKSNPAAFAAGFADTLVGRLVALQAERPSLSDGKIRAVLVGLATGFVPTTTLGAGNMLIELLKRPAVWQSALDAARGMHNENAPQAAREKCRADLKAILHEAGRLNPALLLGQWRYAVADGEITRAKRKISRDTVVMVATASALRDSRAFESPNEFRPGRAVDPDLMFGNGAHSCIGKYLAMDQITEIFAVLFAQPNLRRRKGKHGRLEWLGPFPDRLDMDFDAPFPTAQSMVTICIPVDGGTDVDELRRVIRANGNPAGGQAKDALQRTNIVHFASLSVVAAGDAGAKPTIVFELNVDGGPKKAIADIAGVSADWLGPILKAAGHCAPNGDAPDAAAIVGILQRHLVSLHSWPWGATGLDFNGTPEFSVCDIERQTHLAQFARRALTFFFKVHIGMRAMVALQFVRKLIHGDAGLTQMRRSLKGNDDALGDELQALIDEGKSYADLIVFPNRRHLKISRWVEPKSWFDTAKRFLSSRTGLILIAVTTAFALAIAAAIYFAIGPNVHLVGRLVLAAVCGVGGIIILSTLTVYAFLGALRLAEESDVPDDQNPNLAHVREVSSRENSPGYAQNHFTAVTALKPGWFRKLTLSVALWGIAMLVKHRYRPGFVLDMGTIHYARWFRLPGSEKLIFLSNFDGSWESYLEDFVTKAHAGQSAAWSNGRGFPRTRYMILDGAQDGDRFKRWVRRQQVVSEFWYSRFPALTTDEIRNNAVIHDGLARATTDTAARQWLACFGSMQRPEGALESEQIQGLVFRGYGRLQHGLFAALRLPDDRDVRKTWLAKLAAIQDFDDAAEVDVELQVAFGDHSAGEEETATFVAFSAGGLKKLGLPSPECPEGLGSFPAAFNFGMASRERTLSDEGMSSPENWRWLDAPDPAGKSKKTPVDCALLIYGRSAAQCQALLERHMKIVGGDAVLYSVPTCPPADAPRGPLDDALAYEHFGFRDGISQPVIRGTQRFVAGALERDIVEPGEFVLGYLNNQGYYPPTAAVRADADIRDRLPIPARAPSRFPDFRAPLDTLDLRDLGRNGSFLVVRQFSQDVKGFTAFTATKAAELNSYDGVADVVGELIDADWIAAKIVGRRRDGTPLIDRQSRRHAQHARPGNDFAYGVDDPRGLHCPLGSHIRRANPRDSFQPGSEAQQRITNRHRLLRRGRAYENPPDVPEEKGLLFVCICADLERQFEFVQQSWIGSPSFHGLSNEPDPLSSTRCANGERTFTIPTSAGPLTLRDMQSFVTVHGGGYFFLPGRAALQFFWDLAASS